MNTDDIYKFIKDLVAKPKRTLALLAGLVVVLIIVALINGFMGETGRQLATPKEDAMKLPKSKAENTASQNTTVSSINQQGGITAGTVTINVGQTKRVINSSLSLDKLRKYAGTKVFLHWRADDNESVIFRDNINEYLNSVDWIVRLSAPHTSDETMSNVLIEINRDSPQGDNSLSAALSLKDILKKSEIIVSVARHENNPLPVNSMYLRIGPIR